MSVQAADTASLRQLLNRRAIEAELERRRAPFLTMFPERGPHRRELYSKHLEFFFAGAQYKERLFMAANRVGKTVAGAFETACHLTGHYPEWWQGRRFDHATDGWACGANSQTTRDVVQGILLGKSTGQGMIPIEAVVQTTAGRGITGSIETVWVKHVSGKTSKLGFKTYEQGRRAFEGEAKDFIWCDEEPPMDVYTELLYRLLTTKGIISTTFTPLLGMSEVVTSFLEPPDGESKRSKYVVQAGWKDVPHLDEEEKRKLVANTPPYQVRARTDGEPALGSGAIYPIDEAEITVPDRPIPDEWPRAFGMDVGWNRTAVVWGARTPLPGSRAAPAVNAVEAGITEVWNLLVSGRLKVMASLTNWLREFRKYHRDDKGSGKIVKRDDHLMDATRYLIVSGRLLMTTEPRYEPYTEPCSLGPDGWMA